LKRIFVESPFAGFRKRNKAYARWAMLDCVNRGESPYVPHLLLTQVLDDKDAVERLKGTNAAEVWRDVADLTVFYCDLGFSRGMALAYDYVVKHGIPFELRTLWKPITEVEVPNVPVDEDED